MSYSSMVRAAALALATLGMANSHAADTAIPVDVNNFARAESDLYMSRMVADGSFGKFFHSRQPVAIEAQNVIRMNRDTLYSGGVFDLDAGPVTIDLPDSGERFMSMLVVNEDHYVPAVFYGAGRHVLTKAEIGTRYVFVAIRTLVNPANKKDLEQVHALQDAIRVSQDKTGEFVIPKWEQASQKKVRDALQVLAATIPDYNRAFGPKDQVDPVQHLLGTAAGWGGNPSKDAIYLSGVAPQNDGKTVYRLNVGSVPVHAFWSIAVYNAEGYFQKNPYDAYSLNNLTAEKNANGSIDIQFGGCDGKIANCLPITPGWNYTVRLYQPAQQILDGQWRFPQPQPVPR